MWILLLIGGVLAAPKEAEDADKVSVSLIDDFELRYYVVDDRIEDPDDVAVLNYVEQVNRLNAVLSSGPWSLDVQVDEVALFANRYFLDDELIIERELVSDDVFSPLPGDSYLNVEKLRLRYETQVFSLAAGDNYVAFGRGIALNLNRNVDIDIDTSVQGLKMVARPGAWDLTAVLGQLNRQQVFQDNPNAISPITGDLRHTVGAVRAERFGLGPANLGAHAVAYDFVKEPGIKGSTEGLDGAVDALVGGATAELFGVGGIDWYVESDLFGYPVDGQLAPVEKELEGKLGHASYASAAFYPGKLVFLVEGKRYFQAERVNALLAPELYEVAVAPTLEYDRAVTEDSSAALNSNDIWGGRVRMDWAAKPGELVPFASVGVFRDLEVGGLHFNSTPETIVHPLAGVEFIQEHGAALVNVGYRMDRRDSPGAVDHGTDRQLHGDAAVKFPFVAGLHSEVQVAAESYQWGNNEFQQGDFVEVESGLTIQKGSAVALTWFTDYTTNELVDSTGNLAEAVYGAAELQVKPSSAVTLKAFYGAYKAGIRCSGGQCRLLPGFKGARMSVTGSF